MSNRVRRMLWAALWLAFALAARPSANAQGTLLFTLQNPSPTVTPGNIFQFDATLQNSDTVNTITLADVFSSISDNGTITTEYFNTGDVPTTLGPVGSADPNTPNSYMGRLFDVQVNATALPGDSVTGSYSIDYQVNGGSVQTETQNFAITVAAVPETGTVVSLGLLVSASLLLRRRLSHA